MRLFGDLIHRIKQALIIIAIIFFAIALTGGNIGNIATQLGHVFGSVISGFIILFQNISQAFHK